MMNQEQVSPFVYGLFYDVDYEGCTLLGLYNLEGEAEAARAHYIAMELEDFNYSRDERAYERKHLEKYVVIRRLSMGQVPSLRFAA